jgi:hypothetical protein
MTRSSASILTQLAANAVADWAALALVAAFVITLVLL